MSAAAHEAGEAMLERDDVLGLIGEGLEYVAVGIDLIGVAIIIFGFVVSLIGLIRCLAEGVGLRRGLKDLTDVRIQLGVYILVGVEFMIASDIIHTVVTRELEDLVFVAALVAIRTAISFFLGREIAEVRREREADDAGVRSGT